MKRLIMTIALAVAAAGLGVSSAVAERGGNKGSATPSASCTTSGNVTVRASNGGSAWIGDQHWLILRLTGWFTPAGGQTVMFTKVYGHKTGFLQRSQQSCSGSQTENGDTFAFRVTVARTSR